VVASSKGRFKEKDWTKNASPVTNNQTTEGGQANK